MLAQHPLDPLEMLLRFLDGSRFIQWAAKFCGIACPLGRFTSTVQQVVIAGFDRGGEPPVGLAFGPARPLVQLLGGGRRW